MTWMACNPFSSSTMEHPVKSLAKGRRSQVHKLDVGLKGRGNSDPALTQTSFLLQPLWSPLFILRREGAVY